MRYKLSIPVTVCLIVITIAVIAAFQAYWLRKNYREEGRWFKARTTLLFRETIFRMQAFKLKLDSNIIQVREREGMIGVSDVLRDKVLRIDTGPKLVKIVTSDRLPPPSQPRRDSLNVRYRIAPGGGHEARVIQFLTGVDSLRDSITVQELTNRYRKVLDEQKVPVAFTIKSFPADTMAMRTGAFPDELESNNVTIGFTKPITYQVNFASPTWYLIRRISQPILISAFLLGMTLLSFLLLYRNLKRQQQLAQLKNDFISNMTHELKTPIATVSVAIEALRNFNVLEDPQLTNEYLDISANEMQRLALLVDKVLKLSMFENREISLNKESIDLRALARSVMVSMKLQFEQKQATTALKTTGTNFTLQADKLHMTSVLYNLLDNALKYSLSTPDIEVHIIDHKTYLELRVSDNGIGIATEYRQRIFEKFFRVPSGNRHNIKGYGLGLSYVFHIVMRHMGFITVESEVDKGSSFSILLPFAEAAAIPYGQHAIVHKTKFG